ncbi:MAG: S8 family serine peptidase [Gemmatimonadota bacterium]
MNMRNTIIPALALLAAGAGFASSAGEQLSSAVSAAPDKIDAAVQRVIDRGDSASVLVLGTRQLLAFPDGFAHAARRWDDRPRRELRAALIDSLKRIADTEQAEMAAIAGVRGTSLWIINAVAGRLAPAEIQRLSELSSVRYIYPAGQLPRPPDRQGVAFVLEPGPRPAFSLEGKTVPWNVEKIGARRVWDELGVTAEGSVVAMLDLGVNYQHTELIDNIWINSNEIPNNGRDDDGNGYVDDLYGFDFGAMTAEVGAPPGTRQHGTMTSGIVASSGAGGIQTGIAPRARIMPLRATGLVANMRAYQYALDNGADVLNMSFSRPNLGHLRAVWRLMAEQAAVAGLVSVSGAGNFRETKQIPEQQRIPEGIPSVISAGGVDSMMNLLKFSSMGPVEWQSVKFYEDHPELIKPDVVAFPGAGYPLIDSEGVGYLDPNDVLRGNSFSGPHASGVAALMLSANPDLPAWRVKELMEQTARDLGPEGKDNRTGAGLVDAFAAVKAALAARQH